MKIDLYNNTPQGNTCSQSYNLSDLKKLDDNEYFLFVSNLSSALFILSNKKYFADEEVENKIFCSAFTSSQEPWILRKGLTSNSYLFATRQILIAWFLNRGRFDLAYRLMVPEGRRIITKISAIINSNIYHFLCIFLPLLLFIIYNKSHAQLISTSFIPAMSLPILYFICSLRSKRDLKFNLLLRVELFTPTIILSMISTLLLIVSSEELIIVLCSFTRFKLLVLAACLTYFTSVAWAYGYMKNAVAPVRCTIRGMITTVRLLTVSIVINTWGYALCMWKLVPSENSFIKLVAPTVELVKMPVAHFNLYPNFVLVSTFVCVFLATFIHFLFENRKLA